MAYFSRFVRLDQPTIYHIVNRTALDGYPLLDQDKDHLLSLIVRLSRLYFVDLLGFCLMGNHSHIVVRIHPEQAATNEEIVKRLKNEYGEKVDISPHQLKNYNIRLNQLGTFMKDVKQRFTQYFNRRTNRKGFLWGQRFKSVIVQEGFPLLNLLAYVDLNPLRANLVEKPEMYPWNTLGCFLQCCEAKEILRLDLWKNEWKDLESQEIISKYRQFVYETGAIKLLKGKRIDPEPAKLRRKKDYRLIRARIFSKRCRYFTDSGVIGSKEFVSEVFDEMKHMLFSKDTRNFTPITGIDGVYSMKRLHPSIQ